MPAAVRSARPGDAAVVAAIYNEGIEERTSTFETAPRTAADVESWLTTPERFPVIVAEKEGVVSGWARIQLYSERDAYAGVGEASVYVRSSARGRGLGRRLLTELAAQAERLGYGKLTGKLFTDNGGSAALVRCCGWREVGGTCATSAWTATGATSWWSRCSWATQPTRAAAAGPRPRAAARRRRRGTTTP